MSTQSNALRILEQVVAAGPGVTAKEISTALRLPPATTYRLLNLLVAEEYLVRLPDLRGFALGRRSARLSLPQVPEPCAAARAVVTALRHRVRWGVHLAAYTGGRLTLTDPDPDHPPTDDTLLARYPHASSLGKLLLADQPARRAGAHDLRHLTEHTITDTDRLARELAVVSDTGVAIQLGELRPERGCLAVAIRNPATGMLVAGLALCAPPDRIQKLGTELLPALRDHADQLTPLLS
jgi:DNA-binding IclR family transcriptional regulator